MIMNVMVKSVLSHSASVTKSSGSTSMTICKVGYESGLDMVWHTTELRGCFEEGLNGILCNSLFYDYPYSHYLFNGLDLLNVPFGPNNCTWECKNSAK